MARYALINSGIVRNVAVGDADFAALVASHFDAVVDVTAIACGPGWAYDGSTFTAPVETLAEAQERRTAAIKAEGLARIQAVMPAVSDIDTLELVRELILSIAPAARQLTADMTTISNIYAAARTALIAIRNATTVAQVDAVTVSWPS